MAFRFRQLEIWSPARWCASFALLVSVAASLPVSSSKDTSYVELASRGSGSQAKVNHSAIIRRQLPPAMLAPEVAGVSAMNSRILAVKSQMQSIIPDPQNSGVSAMNSQMQAVPSDSGASDEDDASSTDDDPQAKLSDTDDERLGLDRLLKKAAGKAGEGPTQEILTMLRVCAHCDRLETIGGDLNDGAFVMCTDGLKRGLVGAYSYGIRGQDDWGMEIAQRYDIPVFEFDCMHTEPPVACEGCNVQFHEECVFKHDGQPPSAAHKNLETQLEETGNANAEEGSLLMKLDVASHEWQILYEEPTSILQKFRQIVVEYHRVGKMEHHPYFLQTLKTMDEAGFAVAHVRDNSRGRMFNIGQYQIPDILEVTYVRNPSQGCATGLRFHSAQNRPDVDEAAEIQDVMRPSPTEVEDEDSLMPTESRGFSLMLPCSLVLCLGFAIFSS